MGYLYRPVPVGHPDYGRLFPCVCQQEKRRAALRERLYAWSRLRNLSRFTFETFRPEGQPHTPPHQAASLRMAYEAARAFAAQPQGWLLFSGPYGCGKTHLAAAIANAHQQAGGNPLVVFLPDLLDHLRATFRPDSPVTYDQRFEMLRTASLLVLDDLGRQATSPWAREKLYQLLNYRYVTRKPTVITTLLTLAEFEPWLRTRLLDQRLSRVVSLAEVPSYITGRGTPPPT